MHIFLSKYAIFTQSVQEAASKCGPGEEEEADLFVALKKKRRIHESNRAMALKKKRRINESNRDVAPHKRRIH